MVSFWWKLSSWLVDGRLLAVSSYGKQKPSMHVRETASSLVSLLVRALIPP